MGNRLSKIYTRTGDTGTTGLSDGIRVAKDHPRIEAIGEIDSLNCQLGVLLAELEPLQAEYPGLTEIIDALSPCQHRLFDFGGELSMPAWEALHSAEVERLEHLIDDWNQEVGPLKDFILPGGSRLIALAHQARASARTAERRCQTLNAQEPLRPVLLAYVNRLSDLLFVAARLIAKRQRCPEILWQASQPQA